jgi:hypothetical protein
MHQWEIQRWNSLPARVVRDGEVLYPIRDWHSFFKTLESLVYKDVDLSAEVITCHADSKSNALHFGLIRKAIEASDAREVERLGWGAPRGLDILDPVLMEIDVDRQGPGIDKVTIVEEQDLMSIAQMRVSAQEEQYRALSADSASWVYPADARRSLIWLALRAGYFVSSNEVAAAETKRLECRQTGVDDTAKHATRQQKEFDKTHDREHTVSNPYCDRVWRMFEALEGLEMNALIFNDEIWTSRGRLELPEGYESQSPRQYEKAWWWAGTNRAATLPRKCFVDWIDWPDTKVFGDVKDGVKAWLRGFLKRPLDVRKTHVLIAGRILKPDGEGNAQVRVPKSVWRSLLRDAHPGLAAMHEACVKFAVDVPPALRESLSLEALKREIQRRWGLAFQAAMNKLSYRREDKETGEVYGEASRLKFRRFVEAYSKPPEVRWNGEPLKTVARRVRDWRLFYETLEGLSPQLPKRGGCDHGGLDSRGTVESQGDLRRGLRREPGEGQGSACGTRAEGAAEAQATEA